VKLLYIPHFSRQEKKSRTILNKACLSNKSDQLTILYLNFNVKIMGNLLYVIAVILVIIWAISFLGGYYTGGIIHALLVIAIVAILLRVIRGAA
jgi:hypothetical protein